jgi:outer membrane protein TolC
MMGLIGFLSAFVLLLPPAPPSERIGLDQAVQDGLKKNLEYLNRSLDLESAALKKSRAGKSRLFQVDARASYAFQSETMTIQTPGVSLPGIGDIPGTSIEAGVHHSYDLSLRLSQPLYTGGVLSRTADLEAVGEAIARNQMELERDELTGRIKTSYFQFHLLENKQRTLESLHETLDRHRARLESLVSEGLARESDRLETLSRIEENRIALREIEDAVERERIHFRALSGHTPEEIEPGYRESGSDPEAALDRFISSHPVVKSLDDRLRAIALKERILEGSRHPQVAAFAEAHYGRPGIDFFTKEWMAYFQGGLAIDWKLFDWNRAKEDRAILEIESRRIGNQREQVIRDAEEALTQLFFTLDSLHRRLEHADRLLALAEKDSRLKSELYTEKLIPNVDYLTALHDRERHRIRKDEIIIQIELIKVNINTLTGHGKEDSQ